MSLPVEPVESNIEYDNEKRNTSDYFDNEKINKFYKSVLKILDFIFITVIGYLKKSQGLIYFERSESNGLPIVVKSGNTDSSLDFVNIIVVVVRLVRLPSVYRLPFKKKTTNK